MVRSHGYAAQSRMRRSNFAKSSLLAATAAIGLSASFASAANGTWSAGGVDQIWTTSGNWVLGSIPGSTAGASGTSTDIATFQQAGGTGLEASPDNGRNIQGIIFDIQTAGSGQAIGPTGSTNILYLTAGATVQTTAANISTTSSGINNPIVLLGNAIFRNDSTTGSAGMKINASLTSGAAGPITITLDGVNASGNLTSNNQWVAAITDGPGSPVGIVQNGTAEWDFRATAGLPNTYSGDTLMNSGAIRFNGTGALSPNSNYIVNQGATFRPSISGTIKSLTANSCVGYITPDTTVRSTLTESGGAVINIPVNSGAALTLNMASQVNAGSLGVPTNLTGTVAGQGGVTLTASDLTAKITYSRPIDLGTVSRPFDIARSAANATAGDPDLQVSQSVTGSGGITKTGPGHLRFNTATYTGATTVEAGRLTLAVDAWGPALTGPNGADIKHGQIAFNYTGTTTPAATVKGLLTTGYGSGFASGQLRNTAATSSIGLGWADDGTTNVRVAATYYGDADLNGIVDTVDFNLLAASFSQPGVWANADFDYSGTVDTVDFNLLASNFAKPGLLSPALGGSLGALVPEPVTCGIAAMIAAGSLLNRRRR